MYISFVAECVRGGGVNTGDMSEDLFLRESNVQIPEPSLVDHSVLAVRSGLHCAALCARDNCTVYLQRSESNGTRCILTGAEDIVQNYTESAAGTVFRVYRWSATPMPAPTLVPTTVEPTTVPTPAPTPVPEAGDDR